MVYDSKNTIFVNNYYLEKNIKNWMIMAGRMTKEEVEELSKVEAEVEFHKKRIVAARLELKKKLRGEELEDAMDELKCAVQDLAFQMKEFEKLFSAALKLEDDSIDETVYENQPHEIHRKAQFESKLGHAITWSTYWKMLNEMYKDQAAAREEDYEESVAGYVHRFDCRADNGGSYDSDKGLLQHSDVSARVPSYSFNALKAK
jgi:hypothetical protein